MRKVRASGRVRSCGRVWSCGVATLARLLALLPTLPVSGAGGARDGVNVTVVTFQVDGLATTNSMLDTGIGIMPTLTQVTLCARYRLLHSGENSNPIVSYFGGADNEIYLAVDFRKQMVQFHCCNFLVLFDVDVVVKMYRWHHLCVSLNLPTSRWVLIHDDTFVEREVEGGVNLVVRGGGRLVMGQDIDSLEGGLNMRQAMHGDIANFLLYPKALDSGFLKAYVNCRSLETEVEPILSFDSEMTNLKKVGSTAVSQTELDNLCQEESGSMIMVSEKMDFSSALTLCSKMKGRMALPTNKEENIRVFNYFLKFNDLCVDAYGTLYWLGIKGDLQSKQWLILPEKKTLTWSNLVAGYNTPKVGQACASVGGADFPLDWFSTPCDYLTCPLCAFTDTPVFRVRGLCPDSIIDQNLYLRDYKNDKVQFHGPYYSVIDWDQVNLTWKISSRGHDDLNGYMELERPGMMPVGVHSWVISGDNCLATETDLLITACRENEYTCNDGACIKKSERCDLATDCLDLSDELGCQLAQVPDGYTIEMPPPKELDNPIPVRIFVEITSIREMNILGFKMAIDIILRLYWRDGRLTMKNLRDDIQSNKIQDHKRLWLPELQVEDGARSLADLFLRAEAMMVQREGRPIPDDPTKLNEDDLYLGSENTLLLQQVYTVSFTCQFQLQFYPFDSQLCSLAFTLDGVSPSFVVLNKDKDGVAFTGQRKLLEYKVTTFNMTPEDSSHAAGQRVWLEMRNLSGYYLSNTYTPTLLLVIICYLTLFFDIADFTDRVMVSLTSLLVLAALFSQTSQAIPKTAYLKLIDLWFVFLIVMEFVIVLILVIVENLRLRKNKVTQGKVTIVSVSTRSNKFPYDKSHFNENVNKTASWANKLAIVVLPILMSTFILGYAVFCFTAAP